MYSKDGTRTKGGRIEGVRKDAPMAKEFKDMAFSLQEGEVSEPFETEFGFHLLKVDKIRGQEVDVRHIIIFPEVSQTIVKAAPTFEMETIKADKNDFLSIAESQKFIVKPIDYVNMLDENLPGLFSQRQIVQWDLLEGDIDCDIKKFNLSSGGGYAVVQISKARDKNIADIEEVRVDVFEKLKNEKKAELLKTQYNSLGSIEELSQTSNTEIQSASALTQLNAVLVGAGQEPYVIGAAFSLDDKQTSGLINGLMGLYKIKLMNKNIAVDLANYSAYSLSLKNAENSRINSAIFEALKSAASIEDNRPLYY